MSSDRPTVVIPAKSAGVAILLTILLGPLGMLYSTIGGAIVMTLVALIVGIPTLGLGLLVVWPVCIVWSAMAARGYNRRIMRRR